MSVLILKMICPVTLGIAMFYPYYRGLKGVYWWKSILLGWGFFVMGCLMREHVTPAIAMAWGGVPMAEQVKCANSMMFFGIALGWFFPLVFHGLGMVTKNEIGRLRKRRLSR